MNAITASQSNIKLISDVAPLREDIPVLHQKIQGKPLAYLDNAASSQRPQFVIDAVNNYSLKTLVIDLQMPPYGSSPLSGSEINIITNWIDCE